MLILHPLAKNLTGQTFNFWTAIEPVRVNKHGSVIWLCHCRCGFTKEIDGQSLRRGTSQSCGCKARGENFTRGEVVDGTPSREFLAYHGAKGRCTNPNNNKYLDYGGRGIEFRFASFDQFIAEVGRKPSKEHTLDRMNVDGHYEPGNVRWATPFEQSNNKRNNVPITALGKTQPLSQWAKESDLRIATVTSRIYLYNWCHDCAVTLPVSGKKRRCSHR